MKTIKINNFDSIIDCFTKNRPIECKIAVVNIQIGSFIQTQFGFSPTLISPKIDEKEFYYLGVFGGTSIYIDALLRGDENIISFVENIEEYKQIYQK